MNPKLKMGIGGGGGIGTVHQMAARLDGKIELVAGAFSSNVERSKRSGERLSLHPSRVYGDYQPMAAEEAKLPADERIDWMTSLEWPSWRRRSKARQTEGHEGKGRLSGGRGTRSTESPQMFWNRRKQR